MELTKKDIILAVGVGLVGGILIIIAVILAIDTNKPAPAHADQPAAIETTAERLGDESPLRAAYIDGCLDTGASESTCVCLHNGLIEDMQPNTGDLERMAEGDFTPDEWDVIASCA